MRRQQLADQTRAASPTPPTTADQTRAAPPTPPTTPLLVERRHRRQLLSLQSSTRTQLMALPPVMAVLIRRPTRPSVPAPLIWPHWLLDAASMMTLQLTRRLPSLPPNPTPALSVAAVNAKHGNGTAAALYPSDAADIGRRDRRPATPIAVREPAAQDNDDRTTKRRSILWAVRRGFRAVGRMFCCWRPDE